MTVAEHDIHSTRSPAAIEQIARWALADSQGRWGTGPTVAAAQHAAAHGDSRAFTAALADLADDTGPGSRARSLLATVWGNGDAASLALGKDLRALYRTATHRGEGLDVAEIATPNGLTVRAESTGEQYQTEVLIEDSPGQFDLVSSRTVTATSAAEAVRAAALIEHEAGGLTEQILTLVKTQLDRLERLIATDGEPVERSEPADIAAERATARADLPHSEQLREELRHDLPATLPAWPAPAVRHAVSNAVSAAERSDAEFRSALQTLIDTTAARGERYQATHAHAQRLLETGTAPAHGEHAPPATAAAAGPSGRPEANTHHGPGSDDRTADCGHRDQSTDELERDSRQRFHPTGGRYGVWEMRDGRFLAVPEGRRGHPSGPGVGPPFPVRAQIDAYVTALNAGQSHDVAVRAAQTADPTGFRRGGPSVADQHAAHRTQLEHPRGTTVARPQQQEPQQRPIGARVPWSNVMAAPFTSPLEPVGVAGPTTPLLQRAARAEAAADERWIHHVELADEVIWRSREYALQGRPADAAASQAQQDVHRTLDPQAPFGISKFGSDAVPHDRVASALRREQAVLDEAVTGTDITAAPGPDRELLVRIATARDALGQFTDSHQHTIDAAANRFVERYDQGVEERDRGRGINPADYASDGARDDARRDLRQVFLAAAGRAEVDIERTRRSPAPDATVPPGRQAAGRSPDRAVPTSAAAAVGDHLPIGDHLRWLSDLHRLGVPDGDLAQAAAPLYSLASRAAAAVAVREEQHVQAADVALQLWQRNEAVGLHDRWFTGGDLYRFADQDVARDAGRWSVRLTTGSVPVLFEPAPPPAAPDRGWLVAQFAAELPEDTRYMLLVEDVARAAVDDAVVEAAGVTNDLPAARAIARRADTLTRPSAVDEVHRGAGMTEQDVQTEATITEDAVRMTSALHPAEETREAGVLAQTVTAAQIAAAPTVDVRQALTRTAAAQQALATLRAAPDQTVRDVLGLYRDGLQHGYTPVDAAAAARTETTAAVHAIYLDAHDELDHWAEIQLAHRDAQRRTDAPANEPARLAAERHTAGPETPPANRTGEETVAGAALQADTVSQEKLGGWLDAVAAVAGRDVSGDEGWSMLAATLDRAAASGWSVADHLPDLAGRGPIQSPELALDLAYRVMDACPESIPAPPTSEEMNGQPPRLLGRGREQAEASIQRPRQPPELGHAVER